MIKNRGDTITVDVSFKDETDALFDPDNQSHEVFAPGRTSKGTLNPTKQSLGVWRIEYNIPSDATFGDWWIESKGVKGTYSETEIFRFTVEKKPGET